MKILFFISVLFFIVACKPNTASNASSAEKSAETGVQSLQMPTKSTEIALDSARCFGTEPFWDVKISEKTGIIVYHHLGDEISVTFPYQKPIAQEEYLFYKTTDGKNTLAVVLKKENCSDGMSDSLYAFSSEVVFNAKKIKGCGGR